MKLTELKVLSVARSDYIPKGKTQGVLTASCIDGRTDGGRVVPTFVDVEVEDLPNAQALVGKTISVTLGRAPFFPYDGSPLKVIGTVDAK